MTTLEKLYSIIANAADCNVKLGDDVYRQIAEMEELKVYLREYTKKYMSKL